MPSKTSPDNLASFIRQLGAATLSSVLIELAADHAAVHERLVRLQASNQPKALATVFRKKLAAWKRSTQYVGYSQAGEFGRNSRHGSNRSSTNCCRAIHPRHCLWPKSTLAEAFLKYGRPEGALVWLDGSWEHLESTRRHLHAQALVALGRTGEAAMERWSVSISSRRPWRSGICMPGSTTIQKTRTSRSTDWALCGGEVRRGIEGQRSICSLDRDWAPPKLPLANTGSRPIPVTQAGIGRQFH